MATEAARLDGKKIHISNNKTVLTHTGLLMEDTNAEHWLWSHRSIFRKPIRRSSPLPEPWY